MESKLTLFRKSLVDGLDNQVSKEYIQRELARIYVSDMPIEVIQEIFNFTEEPHEDPNKVIFKISKKH